MNHTVADASRKSSAIEISSPPGERLAVTSWRAIAAPLGTAFAYYLAAKIGALLAFPSAPVSALWAPNAILLAALVLARRERWWIFLAAVLPFHILAQLPDIGPSRIAIQYVANSAEAVLGALALVHFCPQPRRFDRLHTVLVLVLLAGILAPLLTSVLMVAAFSLAGIAADFWLTVIVRTITNTFAIVALVPLIAMAADSVHAGRRDVPLLRVMEAAGLAFVLAAVCALVFASEASPRAAALLFGPLPLLAWATIRFGVSGACCASLVVGAISTWGVLHGLGPFDNTDPIENALSIVSYHVVVCVTCVLAAALLEEWRYAGRALHATESLHSAVLGSLHDQIAVLDRGGRILETNASWRLAVELAHPARFDRVLAGESYLQASERAAEVGNRAAADELEGLRRVLDGRETRCHFEYLEPSGIEQACIEVSIEQLRRPEGGAIVTRTDVTAKKRAEREARAQQQQLTHLGRAAVLGQLSGAFAHELNQPLTSILGNAEAGLRLIETGTGDPREIADILRDIVRDDERAARVIERLRALLEKGDIVRRPVDVNAAASEVLELAKSELLTRGVIVSATFDAALPLVLADHVQLQQIVLNLLMNACEAMSGTPVAERKVRLSTSYLADDACVQISVSDTGCGIPADDLERIFLPFVSTKPHGMGLGLAICRSVAESHRGRLWAERGADGGAVLNLRIPVTEVHA
jgi:signal transduction histidine kinase/integral membrane sensor domain MASE1